MSETNETLIQAHPDNETQGEFVNIPQWKEKLFIAIAVTEYYNNNKSKFYIDSISAYAEKNELVFEKYLNDWEYLHLVDTSGNKIVIDLSLNTFKIHDSLEWAKYTKEKSQITLSNDLEKLDDVLAAMEHIFKLNESEVRGYINDDDIVTVTTFWDDLKWKDLNFLSDSARELFVKIHFLSKESATSIEHKKDLSEKYQKYLQYVMWIWDKYEGGISYIQLPEEQIDVVVWSILSPMNTSESFYYLIDVHAQIDSNNFQSSSVEEYYKLLAKKLHLSIFKKLKNDEWTTDWDYIELAKIITGRLIQTKEIPILYSKETKETEYRNDIDSKLKDPDLANQILLHMMYREGWVISKIQNDPDFKIEDEKIKNRSAWEVVNNCVEKLNERQITYIERTEKDGEVIETEKIVDGREFIEANMGPEILQLWNQSYDSLSIQDKVLISTLARLEEKLADKKMRGARTGYKKKLPETLENLITVFNEISQDAYDDVRELYEDNFEWTFWNLNWDWKDSSDFNSAELEPLEKEALELFNEINGNGFFDLSDKWWATAWTVGKIGAVIWLAILVAWPATATALGTKTAAVIGTKTVWLMWTKTAAALTTTKAVAAVWTITQWTAIWGAASVMSMWVMWKGYDSWEEFKWDASTDIAFWALTWAIWWGLVIKYWSQWAKYISREGLQNSWIFAGDLAFLGLLPEWIRADKIEEYFSVDKFQDIQSSWEEKMTQELSDK